MVTSGMEILLEKILDNLVVFSFELKIFYVFVKFIETFVTGQNRLDFLEQGLMGLHFSKRLHVRKSTGFF